MLLNEEVSSKARANPVQAIRNWRFPLKWYRRLTLASAVSIWLLIVLGGLVRVSESGTGCGASWPLCHGRLLPNFEIHEMIEWTHRLVGFVLGWLMVLTIAVTLLWYRRPRRLMVMALLLGVSYVAQAILGGLTVLFNAGHTWSAFHMGNSMILMAAVVLLAIFARTHARNKSELSIKDKSKVGSMKSESFPNNRLPTTDYLVFSNNQQLTTNNFGATRNFLSVLKWLALATVVWTYVAMFTGSWVIGSDATVACPSWPQCSPTSLLPQTGQQWINFGHRLSVGLSDVALLFMGVAIWLTRRHDKRLMTSVHALGLLYVSQVFVGAFTIWTNASPVAKGTHLALAAATWAALIVMTTFLWMGESQAKPEDDSPDKGEPQNQDEFGSTELVEALQTSATGVPQLATHNSQLATQKFSPTTDYRLPTTLKAKILLYIGLMRPHVIPLLVVPTVASMLIAAVHQPTERNLLELIWWVTLGGVLATGGAHAINQYIDRDIDAKMRRTKRRAVVSGKISPRNALIFGIGISAIAVLELLVMVNIQAAALALSGNLFYVFVYSLWLKRSTAQNIVIGGAAGAVPPLVGWAAVTGGLDLPALLFFAIIFFWTPAHFWALALVRQEDYAAAGIPMLPVVKGEKFTRQNILLYAVLLFAVTLLPFMLNALSWIYLVAAAGLGAVFVEKAFRLLCNFSQSRAMRLFKYSNTYLAVLYLMMVIDRLVAMTGN